MTFLLFLLTFLLGIMAGGRAVLYWLRPNARSTFTPQDFERFNADVRRDYSAPNARVKTGFRP